MYAVGIDIGTTCTAAAVWRDGRAEIVPLGGQSAAIPSAVFVRSDGAVLTGEVALRRALSEPGRVVRELKRRLGDTGPILLGGTPYSATTLTARLLRSVVDAVSAREGAPPAAICLTHPAGWGPYKLDLLHQVVRMADLPQPVRFTTDPQAAACFRAQQKLLGPGAVVAVYDLGGGIFEAAVLRKTADGFDLAGRPEQNERLGGLELDEAVFTHVTAAIGATLDRDDLAIARLRAECVQAKEALTADTEVVIPAAGTEVRLTRSELETVVRPLLTDSIEAFRRTIRSAGYAPHSVGSVLVVGGSARMPLVPQMISSGLGRPVEVDANPQHAVALGAAWLASGALTETRPVSPAPARSTAPALATAAAGTLSVPTGEIPVIAGPAVPPIPRRPLVPAGGFTGRAPLGPMAAVPGPAGPAAPGPAAPGPAAPAPVVAPPAPPAKGAGRRVTAIAAAAASVLLLATGATAWVLTRADDTKAQAMAAVRPAKPVGKQAAVPPDEQCTAEMKKSTRWVCLTKATLHNGTFTVWYRAEWHGTPPDIETGFHLHIYGGDGSSPDESTMGSQAVEHSRYYFEDQEPSVRKTSDPDFEAIGDAKKVCARIAHSGHGLAKAHDGTYHTGNCVPIQRY